MGSIMFDWLRCPNKESPPPTKLDTNPYETMVAFGQVGQKVFVSTDWFTKNGTNEEIAENIASLFIYIVHGSSAQQMLASFESICRDRNRVSLFELIKQKIGNKLVAFENQLAEQEDEPIIYPSEAFGGNQINQPH